MLNMKCHLTSTERANLLKQHKSERDHRAADRIKAVLLSDDGLSNREIARVLFLNEESIGRHIKDYLNQSRLANDSGGSCSKLNKSQSTELISHLNTKLYPDALQISHYVEAEYGVRYSRSGMVNWLHQHGFSYKKPTQIPAKADKTQQIEFAQQYERLKATLPDDAVILFGDGVHPSMETKLSHGWIATGKDKSI